MQCRERKDRHENVQQKPTLWTALFPLPVVVVVVVVVVVPSGRKRLLVILQDFLNKKCWVLLFLVHSAISFSPRHCRSVLSTVFCLAPLLRFRSSLITVYQHQIPCNPSTQPNHANTKYLRLLLGSSSFNMDYGTSMLLRNVYVTYKTTRHQNSEHYNYEWSVPVIFNLFRSRTQRYIFSSTLYLQSFWCIIQVPHSL